MGTQTNLNPSTLLNRRIEIDQAPLPTTAAARALDEKERQKRHKVFANDFTRNRGNLRTSQTRPKAG